MTDDKCSSDILSTVSLATTFLQRLSGAEVKFKAFLSLEMDVNKWSAKEEIKLTGRNKIKQRKEQRKIFSVLLAAYKYALQ
jgi:hypothetical protein